MISFTIVSCKYKLEPAKLSITLIRKFYSYIVVNKLWLALEWYIPMLWLALNGACYG